MKYRTLLLSFVILVCLCGTEHLFAGKKAYREMTSEELLLSYEDNCNSREKANALKDRGTQLINEGKMVDALRMLVIGMIVSEKGGFEDIYDICASNLGVVYGYFGEYGSSAFYNELSFNSSISRGDFDRARITANNLFQTYCNMSELEGAERIYKWLEENPQSGGHDPFRTAFNAYTLYAANQNYIEAHKYAILLNEITAHTDVNVSDKVASSLVLGESFLNLNRYAEAFENAGIGMSLAENANLTGLRLEAYSLMSKIAAATGNDGAKNQYIAKKNNLEDSVMNKNRYYSEKQNLLSLQKQSVVQSIHNLNVRISQQKSFIIVVFSILVLVVATLYIVIRIHLRLKRAYEALYAKNEKWLNSPPLKSVSVISDNYVSGTCNVNGADEISESESGESIDQAERQTKLLDKIIRILEDPETLRNPDFNLDMLVRMAGSNTHYVSCLINTNLGTSFSNYLNERRVRLCCSIIKSNPNIKMSDLWPQAGFGTQRNFQMSFKKIIGMPPSAYKSIVKDSVK